MLYQGEHLKEISFPLGGIGTGCVGLGGNGQLLDWEIIKRPNKGGLNGYSHIAVQVKTKEKTITKVLNSDLENNMTGQYMQSYFRGFGYGPQAETMCAFPHFAKNTFRGEFPIAELNFSDDAFPGEVLLCAFNPMIPGDAENSSIPAAFFELTYRNPTEEELEFSGVFSLGAPYEKTQNTILKNGSITTIKMANAALVETEYGYSDLSVSAESVSGVQKYWYRGGWQDSILVFWKELCEGNGLRERDYEEAGNKDHCSLMCTKVLKPGEEVKFRFVLSWNLPYMKNDWSHCKPEKMWKNYYRTVFEDSVESGVYAIKNWDSLYQRTDLFRKTLFSSTVDEVVLDAVSATMSVLKSPTVYRLENGEFYGFEGVHEQAGSCEGTCQHVYNYAYALCFLFPELERSIRDLEYRYSMQKRGAMLFRLRLPLGEEYDCIPYACVDGQMGTVFKTYREWKISGDNEWLKGHWENVKKALEFAWSPENEHEWDKNKDGVLEGRQHHTLDVELFGPSSWLEGFYLAALKAGAEMAEFMGEPEKAQEYLSLFEKGKAWTKEHLFNGEYFIQKVDVSDRSVCEHFHCVDSFWNEEAKEIKYQIADGSCIDQLTAQWHANICGLGALFDREQVKTALQSMMKYNFKPSLREVTNPWRVFAFNDEAGTIICDYPEGAEVPKIPITYLSECMTGFEYQFAGLLMSEGMFAEGLQVVKAIRDRYDGKKRNPWNEIECGSNYIRAMASFALLPILSGFEFDLPRAMIGFSPKGNSGNFKCLWSLGTGWGSMEYEEDAVRIKVLEGSLLLGTIRLPGKSAPKKLLIDQKEIPFTWENGALQFEKTEGNNCFEILFA